MRARLLTLVLLAGLGATAAFAAVIDGASAPQWTPCLGWVQKTPDKYSVAAEGANLVFTVAGAGLEMPWNLPLTRLGLADEQRYLLVRYQATGLATGPEIYFLHGEEGTYGGRAFAMASDLEADGQWHTLAVDLLAVEPAETTHDLAIKVHADAGGLARLTVERLWFADELPAEAGLAKPPARPAITQTVVDWAKVTSVRERTGWTTTPAEQFSHRPAEGGMTFTVTGPGKGMRWLVALPQPVDLSLTPHLSLSYHARGALGRNTYAIWLGDQESGSGGNAVVALDAGELKDDGLRHNLQVEVKRPFTATYLAIGLDALGEQAELTLGNLTFSSRPRQWRVTEMLAHTVAAGPWQAGDQGFTVLPAKVAGGKPSPFLRRRLDLEDWFTDSDVTIGGVPFRVPTDPTQVPVTALGGLGELTLPVPSGARELYLLTAAAAPPTEPWGIDPAHPRPQEYLDVPEKVYLEIRYASGPPDQVLPLDAATGQWGMKRGLAVTVVHPDPRRQAVAVVVHDGMQTAGFGFVAATAYAGAPRVPEPNWSHLTYPTPPAKALARAKPTRAADSDPTICAGVLQARFATGQGLTWESLGISGLGGALGCARGPVFEVEVAGKLLPAADWLAETAIANGLAGPGGRRFVVRNKAAGLLALVDCAPGKGNELLLRMQLTNEGSAPLKATLRFPVLRGVKLGQAADTWYLYGKRGGIINSAPARFRNPLGENHPLQLDGFFSPKSGLALACLTHDTVAQHHFLNLAKSPEGGEWSPEYPDRDLAPGATFTATEAALVLREGDWRAMLGAYGEWLKTWFRPAAPRQKWFEQSFAICSTNVHYDAYSEPQQRGAIEPLVDNYRKFLGVCDRAHLFGWGSSRTYGDWGDYDHYDEVGGLDYFRANIAAMQKRGVAVSLYLDGYLSSGKGRHVGARAEEWAMRNPDGSPQYIKEYDAYNQCLYLPDWRDYLARACARVQRETGAKVLYIDELGATDGRWICHAKDHGHNSPEIPYAGEVAALKQIREAVGPDVPLFTEYCPAEVTRQYTDGSMSYQALWSADMEPLAPHFIDLQRFAFPDFGQFHIIYYVTNRAGNWWLLKFPFFNGEVYQVGEPNLAGMDAPSLAFQKRAIQVQWAHRETFASHEVTPLVPTQQPGVFANRFTAPRETVWTLYNANGRSVRGTVLRVKHLKGATYEDAWKGQKLQPRIAGGYADIAVELGPKAVGCVTQRLP